MYQMNQINLPHVPPRRIQTYGYALAVAGVAPGKKVVGTVGIAILVVSPNPLARSFGILAAEYPLGAAVIVCVVMATGVCALPPCRQAPLPQAFSHL